MVIRGWGVCQTCDSHHTLRTGVGIEKYQEHYFDCSECGSPITIAVKTDAPRAWYEAKDNFDFVEVESPDSHFINLHPNFSFKSNEYHSRTVFVSLEHGANLIPLIRPTTGMYQNDLAATFEVPNTIQIWSLVKRSLVLGRKTDSHKKVQRLVSDFVRQRQKYRPETVAGNPEEMLYSLFIDIFYPRIEQLLDPAKLLCKTIHESHPKEFKRLVEFYKSDMREERIENYHSIFSDFFRHHGHFTQLLSHARIGDNDVENRIIGSKSFEQIKLYYGQAFETFTAAISLFSALNNIQAGRPFDEFQSMTWNKYTKDVEKAKRANPFRDVPEFFVFTECLDSTLRNGSHHASIWREGEKIYYRSGGSGEKRDIPYSSYVHICNKITISLAALWLLENHVIGG